MKIPRFLLILSIFVVVLAILLYWFDWYWIIVADTSNGYGAHLGCSIVFVANRTLQSALDAEFVFPPISLGSKMTVDWENKCVIAQSTFRPDRTRKACWKSPRLGCTLVFDNHDYQAPQSTFSTPPHLASWPEGNVLDQHKIQEASTGINLTKLDEVVKAHFDDTRLHARAFLLIRNGQIIYERYGDNITASTPLIGWSVTKSVMNALIGIRIRQGHLDLDAPVPIPEWANTNKSHITIRQLLQMSDGIDFDEWYYPNFDVPNMLFVNPSIVSDYLKRNLKVSHQNPCFQYSSGTANLLAYILRLSFKEEKGKSPSHALSDYLSFPTKELFEPIHMHNGVLETDSEGIFIASSFGWGTARDWARFGLLYLNDGVWGERRILPEGWVKFSSSPTKTANGWYAAHFWLGGAPPEPTDLQPRVTECHSIYPSRLDPDRNWFRKAFPINSFVANGYEEQSIAISQQHDLVMVRLGATKEVVIRWDKAAFYSAVFNTIPGVLMQN